MMQDNDIDERSDTCHYEVAESVAPSCETDAVTGTSAARVAPSCQPDAVAGTSGAQITGKRVDRE